VAEVIGRKPFEAIMQAITIQHATEDRCKGCPALWQGNHRTKECSHSLFFDDCQYGRNQGGMRQQLSLLKDNFRRTCPTDPTQRTKPVLPVKHPASLKAENPQLLAELRVLLLVHPGGLEPPTH
jgi:hypothetical protein